MEPEVGQGRGAQAPAPHPEGTTVSLVSWQDIPARHVFREAHAMVSLVFASCGSSRVPLCDEFTDGASSEALQALFVVELWPF